MNEDRAKINIDDRMAEILWDQQMPDPDEVGAPPEGKSQEPSVENILFDITPESLIEYLKGFIVGQDQTVEIIATKICTHLHRMQLERGNSKLRRIVGHVKSNMLLIGPTGVGKTYLIKLIAEKLRIPFVKGDATKFSETGYVGGDVEELVRELVHQVDENISLAEYGIIYIDEIDKIASSTSWHGPDVSRSGVQRNLLKLMEETEVDMKVPHDLASQMEAVIETQRTGKASRKKVNTRNILFVMSGAFHDLPNIIAKRLKKGGMGFSGSEMTSSANVEILLDQLHAQDLMDYGFESEFVGRIPVMTFLRELTEDGLYEILKNPQSAVILSKKRDFAAYNIQLTFADDALKYIARKALAYKTGARGLVSVVENTLLPFERSLPSTSIERLNVTRDVCLDPEGFLKEIVNRHAFESYAKRFKTNTGIEIEFSPSAKRMAETTAAAEGISLSRLLEKSLNNYEYGLKLIGRDRFAITERVWRDPQGYLDRLVKKTYKNKNR